MTTHDMTCEWAGANDHPADREVWEGRPEWTEDRAPWRAMCADHAQLATSALHQVPEGPLAYKDRWAVKVRPLGGAR